MEVNGMRADRMQTDGMRWDASGDEFLTLSGIAAVWARPKLSCTTHLFNVFNEFYSFSIELWV